MSEDQLDDATVELILSQASRTPVDETADPLVQVVADIRHAFNGSGNGNGNGNVADPAFIARLAAEAAAPARPAQPWPVSRPSLVAAAAAAVVALTSGLAAAEQLPAPAQRLVANAAEAVGIDLPGAGDDENEDEDDGGPHVTVTRRQAPPPVVTTAPRQDGGLPPVVTTAPRQDGGQPPTTVLSEGAADPVVEPPNPPATAPGSTSPAATAPGSTAPASTAPTAPGSTAPGATAPRGRPQSVVKGPPRPEVGKPERLGPRAAFGSSSAILGVTPPGEPAATG